MMGLSAGYTWNGQHLHVKGRLFYRRILTTRAGIVETDTRTALMLGLHRSAGQRRLAVAAGIGTVFGGRCSGISVVREIPLLERYIGLGIPVELNATLFRIGRIPVDLSVFGFVQAATLAGDQQGSSLGVGLTTRLVDLF
jgi:hypothetical protein